MSHNPPRGTPRKPYVRVRSPPGPPPTVGHIRSHGVTHGLLYCNAHKCHHTGKIDLARFPDDMVMLDIDPMLRCTKCGGKQCQIIPDWPKVPALQK